MSSSKVRSGFALPAVLAVTGVVTLIFLVAITALASLTAEAASARARVRFLQRALSQEALIGYLAATEPLGSRGLEVGAPRTALGDERSAPEVDSPIGTAPALVWLDGRSYVPDADEGLVLELRDQAGMINLAALDEIRLSRFAERLSLGPSLARNLRSLQIDYTDGDDLKQANGAERSDYGGYLANRPFLRPTEWLSLLGVRDTVDMTRWRNVRSDLAADHTLPTFNVNTASPAALEVMFGLSPDQAASAVAARQVDPFVDMVAFNAATGFIVGSLNDGVYTFPSGRIIYTIRDRRSPWLYRARLTLTPAGRDQPLWIDQTELSEAPRLAVADRSDATRLPYAAR